ncbi:Uncharacterised protein [Citrobacter koseri]|uniref:Uncharacterized protein n=1 Tax=Citrobacter koseri TaxID=545 RepID=A0A3S4I3M6_CITKO|nr:Uncharacterised protein [Citrobacter koseri]
MTHHQPDLSQLNHSLIWDGFRQLIPVSLFVAIFGAAFGLAASQKGVDPTSATMMSLAGFCRLCSIRHLRALDRSGSCINPYRHRFCH